MKGEAQMDKIVPRKQTAPVSHAGQIHLVIREGAATPLVYTTMDKANEAADKHRALGRKARVITVATVDDGEWK